MISIIWTANKCSPRSRSKVGSGAERVERKLAAILAADIAGYSRLMGADEEGTLARLKALRTELIDPTITEHRGCIVKTTGDGLLLSSQASSTPCVVRPKCRTAWPNGMPRSHLIGASNFVSASIWERSLSKTTTSSGML